MNDFLRLLKEARTSVIRDCERYNAVACDHGEECFCDEQARLNVLRSNIDLVLGSYGEPRPVLVLPNSAVMRQASYASYLAEKEAKARGASSSEARDAGIEASNSVIERYIDSVERTIASSSPSAEGDGDT